MYIVNSFIVLHCKFDKSSFNDLYDTLVSYLEANRLWAHHNSKNHVLLNMRQNRH